MAVRDFTDGIDRTYDVYKSFRPHMSYQSHHIHQHPKDSITQSVGKRESWGALIRDLANQLVGLMRDEVALAKRELEQKLKTVQSAAAVVAIGALMALIAALSVCAAVIIALAEYVGPWQSALIVGLVLGMAAGVTILFGILKFKRTSLRPEQTIETIEENKEWLKDLA